ncbi:MAG TPA: hypothetical protein VJY39_15440 [Acidisphaera sp.]|nr:hypothetical protein [Acidisphaera sp.]
MVKHGRAGRSSSSARDKGGVVSSFAGSFPIGVVIVAIMFGSAMLAMAAARLLPEQHLSAETKSVVSVSAAVVGTLSALVVGLLISTSSSSFSAKSQEVTQISTDVSAWTACCAATGRRRRTSVRSCADTATRR